MGLEGGVFENFGNEINLLHIVLKGLMSVVCVRFSLTAIQPITKGPGNAFMATYRTDYSDKLRSVHFDDSKHNLTSHTTSNSPTS